MNNRFFLLTLLSFTATPTFAQTAPPTVPPKRKIQIDPQAMALLDKVAAHYKSVKTIKLVAQGSAVWEGETMPDNLTLCFERPNKIRVQGECDDTKGVFVADGKTVFSWSDLSGSWTHSQNSRDAEPLRDLMATTGERIGSYMSDWLFGEHSLRPLQTDQILIDADTFEARALASTVVNGAPAEGVRFRATKAAPDKKPQYSSEQTLWFRADGRLVKMQLINQLGAKTRRDNITVTEELDNLVLPASTWALKK